MRIKFEKEEIIAIVRDHVCRIVGLKLGEKVEPIGVSYLPYSMSCLEFEISTEKEEVKEVEVKEVPPVVSPLTLRDIQAGLSGEPL